MKEELTDKPNQDLKIDQERLKYIAGIIKRSIMNLKIAKKKADAAWIDCGDSLGRAITNDIDERKTVINDNYEKAMERLETEANALESIANIWNDTEVEIMSSSKNIDDIISNISRSISDFFGNNNKQ